MLVEIATGLRQSFQYTQEKPPVLTLSKKPRLVLFSEKLDQAKALRWPSTFMKQDLLRITQVRKVAGTSLTAYVAEEMGGVVGHIVCCYVGGNVQASKTTGVLYATDRILLNECLRDLIYPSIHVY